MSESERMLDQLVPSVPAVTLEVTNVAACGCDGSGMKITHDEKGNRWVHECSCRAERRTQRFLDRCDMPERYRNTSLGGYNPGDSESLTFALAKAKGFVKAYPFETNGAGVLFCGTVGLGKTHLAVGILRELVCTKGAQGLFCDFRDLLKRIQGTFNNGHQSEADVLKPVFAADVLVLDELAAARTTDWTFDAVENILNKRYNDKKTTIITTNLANKPPGSRQGDLYAAAQDTLGDRIGARMQSRLQEMCWVVQMAGDDYRPRMKGK